MTDEPEAGVDQSVEVPKAVVEAAVPFGGEGATFDAPWQARAFGLAVALADHDPDAWREFQRRIGETVGRADPETMQENLEATYYERWLACLEGVLVERGLLTADELDERAAEFTEGDRDAAEFVVDDPRPGR